MCHQLYRAVLLLLYVAHVEGYGCFVNGTEAVCFQISYSNLDVSIRQLPSNITKLTVDRGRFHKNTLPNGLLLHLTNLEYLNITRCYLMVIEAAALSNLTSLRGIEFTENSLEQEMLRNLLASLHVKKLEYLYFVSNKYYYTGPYTLVDNATLAHFQGFEIDRLNLMNNQIVSSPLGSLSLLHFLSGVRCLFIGYNRMKVRYMDIVPFVQQIYQLSSLVMIDFSYQQALTGGTWSWLVQQHGFELEEKCAAALQAQAPATTSLSSPTPGSVQYPPNFSVVIGRQLDKTGTVRSAHNFLGPSNITHIDFTGFSGIDWNLTSLADFQQLEELHLFGVAPDRSGSTVSTFPMRFKANSFAALKNLRILDISSNVFDDLSMQLKDLFSNCTSLLSLSIGNSSILDPQSQVPRSITTMRATLFPAIVSASSLVNLSLANSELQYFPGAAFLNFFPNLTLLNLKDHDMNTLPTAAISDMFAGAQSKLQLYLVGKQDFLCSCSVGADFPEWLRISANFSNTAYRILDAPDIHCRTQQEESHPALDISLAKMNSCEEEAFPLVYIGYITAAAVVLVVAIILMYSFRFKVFVKYWRIKLRKAQRVLCPFEHVMFVTSQKEMGALFETFHSLARQRIRCMDPHIGLVTSMDGKIPIYADGGTMLALDMQDCYFTGIDNARVIVFYETQQAYKDDKFQFACKVVREIVNQKKHVKILFVRAVEERVNGPLLRQDSEVSSEGSEDERDDQDDASSVVSEITRRVSRKKEREVTKFMLEDIANHKSAEHMELNPRANPVDKTNSHEAIAKQIKQLMDIPVYKQKPSWSRIFRWACDCRNVAAAQDTEHSTADITRMPADNYKLEESSDIQPF